MAQLVERSLLIPDVYGSNPVIGKIYIYVYILNICLLSTVYRKDENKEKEAGNGQFRKQYFNLQIKSSLTFWLTLHSQVTHLQLINFSFEIM